MRYKYFIGCILLFSFLQNVSSYEIETHDKISKETIDKIWKNNSSVIDDFNVNYESKFNGKTIRELVGEGTKFEDMADTFVGPLVFAFSGEELGNAARVFKDFAKSNEALVVKSLSIGEGVMDASQLSAVAALPTYDEAVAKLLFVMKEPVAKLARALTAVKEQKEAAAA